MGSMYILGNAVLLEDAMYFVVIVEAHVVQIAHHQQPQKIIETRGIFQKLNTDSTMIQQKKNGI